MLGMGFFAIRTIILASAHPNSEGKPASNAAKALGSKIDFVFDYIGLLMMKC
jgi:hypothetical protein